jgi:ATP-dependent DNA helicase RecQ
MRGQLPVRMILPPKNVPARRKKRGGGASPESTALPESVKHDALFVRLKDHRAEIAKKKQLPAYVIAHDKTLADLVKKKPRTIGELEGVYGFGPARIEQYGEGFLAVINAPI